MAYRQFIPDNKKRIVRKELMYQVLFEDLLTIFGYGKDTPEFKKFEELASGKIGKHPIIEESQEV